MFDIIIYPIGQLFYFIYDAVAVDVGVVSAYAITIILATIVLKIMMYPLSRKQMKASEKMGALQPELMKLKEKYKDDKDMLNLKTMEFYKESKLNPLGGFLPILIQMPIIIAFYSVIRSPLTYIFKDPEVYLNVSRSFLWISDLGATSNYVFENGVVNGLNMGMSLPLIGSAIPVLAIIAAMTTYLSSMQMNNASQDASLQKNMMSIMSVMIFIFALNMPSGLILYWIVSNIMQIVQNYVYKIKIRKIPRNLKRVIEICFN